MPYQHLTLEERSMMAPMRMLGWSIRSIAAQLGRAPSTISRELRRNCDGSGAYAERYKGVGSLLMRSVFRQKGRVSWETTVLLLAEWD